MQPPVYNIAPLRLHRVIDGKCQNCGVTEAWILDTSACFPRSKLCACGRFKLDNMTWVPPILDTVSRTSHTQAKCYPFPEWTKGKTEEYLLGRHPETFGIDRMGFFSDAPHPENCPCGGSRGHGVHRVGNVCFIGCYGTYAHIEHLKLDWARQKHLALAPPRRPSREEMASYPPVWVTTHGE